MARISIPRRKRIFVGTEGQSERSFAAWLQSSCDDAGLHVHLDVRVGTGGDSLAIAEYAIQEYKKRSSQFGLFGAAAVLLDADRLKEDLAYGRDPRPVLGTVGITPIFLRPTLEGVLVRLHEGQESRNLNTSTVKKVLLNLWPDYKKPCPAIKLQKRFSIKDVRRAAKYDDELKKSVPHPWIIAGLRVCMLAAEDKENKPLFRVISQVYLNPECGREYNSRWEISENRLDLAEQSAFLAGFEVKGPRQSPSVTQMSEKLSRMFE